MIIIDKLIRSEKFLFACLVIQLAIYWGCYFGMAEHSEFVAYQKF